MSKYAITAGVQDSPGQDRAVRPRGHRQKQLCRSLSGPGIHRHRGRHQAAERQAACPQPTSWAMLLDEVAEVRKGSIPCGTLVIDTADWAERLCH